MCNLDSTIPKYSEKNDNELAPIDIIDDEPSFINDNEEKEEKEEIISEPQPIICNNRNILDLGENIKNDQQFIDYAVLPENNLKMFLQNRSQYHRLGANGQRQEFELAKCSNCDLLYPVNGYDTVKSNDGVSSYIDANSHVKNNHNLAAGIMNILPPNFDEMSISPSHFTQHAQKPVCSQAASFQPSIIDILYSSRQQQYPNNAYATMFNGKEYGNNNMSNTYNRIYGNNNNNNHTTNNVSGNFENVAAALLNYGSSTSSSNITKNHAHYLNQVVPPSNYGYYKQF